MKPKQVVLKWVQLFNSGNSNKLAELYHPEAINHQVANKPVKGSNAIKEMFAKEFAAADMTCNIENLFEEGDWAILEWKDPDGLRGCGFFNIVDGKIMMQRGYWDKISFLRQHNLPLPTN